MPKPEKGIKPPKAAPQKSGSAMADEQAARLQAARPQARGFLRKRRSNGTSRLSGFA